MWVLGKVTVMWAPLLPFQSHKLCSKEYKKKASLDPGFGFLGRTNNSELKEKSAVRIWQENM